ncbi:hypothetical protein IWX47DRAFT_848642 [Phyllosticta citricarpa]
MTGNGSDCKNASFGQTDVEVQVQQRVVVVSPNQHHAHVRQARHTHSWWPESDPIQSQTRISAAASAGAPPKKRLARGIHTLRGECGCVHENPLHIRIPYVASRRVSGPRPRQAMCGYLQEAERAVRDLCDVQGELRSTGSPDVWGRQLDALRKSWTVTSLWVQPKFSGGWIDEWWQRTGVQDPPLKSLRVYTPGRPPAVIHARRVAAHETV